MSKPILDPQDSRETWGEVHINKVQVTKSSAVNDFKSLVLL